MASGSKSADEQDVQTRTEKRKKKVQKIFLIRDKAFLFVVVFPRKKKRSIHDLHSKLVRFEEKENVCKREREISNAHTRNANSKTMSTCILTSKDLLYNMLRCDNNCYCSESHTYADWDVSEIDNFEGIFENMVMPLNTTGMETWEVTQVTSMARMFQGTTFSDGIAPEFLNKWSIQINNADNNILTDTSRMFFGSNIRRVFENELAAPYGNVVDMSYMFANTPIETIGSGIDTSSVKIFDCMFQNTSVFAGSMLAYGTPTFFTSAATSMAGMFEGALA